VALTIVRITLAVPVPLLGSGGLAITPTRHRGQLKPPQRCRHRKSLVQRRRPDLHLFDFDGHQMCGDHVCYVLIAVSPEHHLNRPGAPGPTTTAPSLRSFTIVPILTHGHINATRFSRGVHP